MVTYYAVVHYYPDRLRGEFRNIGIVAWGREDWAERLIPELPRDLAEYAGVTIDEFHRRLNELSPDERGRYAGPNEITERMSGPYASIVLRAPCGSIRPEAAVVVDEVWRWFCAPPTSPASGIWVWETPESTCDKGT